MTARDEFQIFESVFCALPREERDAIMERAERRLALAGRGPETPTHQARLRHERDALLLVERPALFPVELRHQARPQRDRHEPLHDPEESDA